MKNQYGIVCLSSLFLPARSLVYSAHTQSKSLLSFFIVIDVQKGDFI